MHVEEVFTQVKPIGVRLRESNNRAVHHGNDRTCHTVHCIARRVNADAEPIADCTKVSAIGDKSVYKLLTFVCSDRSLEADHQFLLRL